MAATSKDQFLSHISNDEFERILRQVYREGIELGEKLTQNEAKPEIDSEEFNPMRLFRSGKHPRFGGEVKELVDDKHNAFRDEWVFNNGYYPKYDFRNFNEWDIQKAIRKLVLSSFNASKNSEVPREHRKEAVAFYDSLADQWLRFADKHLPTYGKEGKQDGRQLSSTSSFQDDQA